MGIDRSFEVAFAKSQLGGGTRVPRKGTVFVSVRETTRPALRMRCSCCTRSASR
jgi:hypothetical protein